MEKRPWRFRGASQFVSGRFCFFVLFHFTGDEQQQLRCRGRADGHRREARVHARVREEIAEEAGALVLRAQDGVVEWWSGVSATLIDVRARA